MAQYRPVSFTDSRTRPAPERLPVLTCILAIASASLALWAMVGLVVRLSL